MNKQFAVCGSNCSKCPTYIATIENDDSKREKVARSWSKLLGMQLMKEDINCPGCHSDSGVLFAFCRNCTVRECGLDKNLDNCAECDSYSCEKLDRLLKIIPPAARENLEVMRRKQI